eukprot:scaffold1168_cov167-Amphora_coffeaeformis.AAC.39
MPRPNMTMSRTTPCCHWRQCQLTMVPFGKVKVCPLVHFLWKRDDKQYDIEAPPPQGDQSAVVASRYRS